MANISNTKNNTLITGTALADSITNTGKNVTINAAAGNDRISLSSAATGNVIQYAAGDGNDTITGFNANSTLSIGGAAYSSAVSGNNVIVTIGDDKITLRGAANLDTVNIVGGDLELATSLVGAMLYRTEAGYPVIAGIALNPTVYHGDEPTNYASKETWTIESSDGLELSGVHYTPEKSNDKWVVIIHGYGHNHKHMYPFLGFYLANNYNVLMVDQRAAGDSEGTWLTMGTAESADIALWTQEIARRYSDSKITLFGVSMGAATAMLAAARNDTANVTSLVEDCGYSNVVEVIDNLNNLIFKIDQATIDLTPDIAESLTGYNLKDAAPINSISSVKVPTLFITGTNDSVVAPSMLSALYDASGAEVKETFYVEGANHGLAGLSDPVGYSNTVFRFIAEADEEGWETENITDGISLRGTSYNDTIANLGTNVTINALGGDDSILNFSDGVIIDGGADNDIINNYDGANSALIGGTGDDFIFNSHAYNVTLDGGDGDDSILVTRGNQTTIFGGAGNDSIFGINDSKDSWAMGGYAVIFGGDGDDYINPIFSDSASVLGGDGNDTIINEGNDSTVNGGAGDDIISLHGASIDNNVIKYDAGDGNDIIYGFNETTKISITSGSEYSTTASGDDVILTVGENTITISGGATLSAINVINYDVLALDINNSVNATLITGTELADTIENSGSNVTINGAANNDSIDNRGANASVFGNSGNDTITNSGENATILGAPGDDNLTNNGDNVLIDGGYGNDIIENSGSNVTIKPEGGHDSISNSGSNVLIDYTGGNDTILGLNETSTLSLGDAAYSSLESGDEIILIVDDNFITLVDAVGSDTLNIIGKSKILTLTDDDAKKVTLGAVVELADATERTTAIKITGNRYDNTILGGWSKDTLLGGRGNDYLEGNAGSDNLSGGADNDTLWGGLGNDTLTGGDGDDLFIFDAGKDVITDYAAGDKISLGAEISVASLNGADAILKIDGGTLRVKDASELTLITSDGTELTTIISNATTYDDTAAAKITLGAGIADADASSRTLAIKITGNRYDNSIVGGSGNDYIRGAKGDDSLWGGFGNDTLNGGAGADTFIYGDGEGNDVISDFGDDDLLQITGNWTAAVDASTIKFTTDDGSLTLKNFTATTFNVNGDDYQISGDTLIKK